MKKCKYCAEEIQNAATICKHCGNTQGRAGIGLGKMLLAGFLMMVIVSLFIGIISNPDSSTTTASPAVAPQPTAASGPVSTTASAAQEFLRAQQSRNVATVRRIEEAKSAGNLNDAVSALEERKQELSAALLSIDDGVASGRFHADDRAMLSGPIEQELLWVEDSLALLASL